MNAKITWKRIKKTGRKEGGKEKAKPRRLRDLLLQKNNKRNFEHR